MTSKSDIGDYKYAETPNAGPHAVTTAGAYTFDYDVNGNMLFKANGGETSYFTWSPDNMPTKVSNSINGAKVEFMYDFAGRRVKKLNEVSGDTIYASSFYEKNNMVDTKHVFDGIRRIVSRQSDGSTFWYHTDPWVNSIDFR